MKTITRENILRQLSKTQGIMAQYADREPRFVESVLTWMEETARIMSRHPLASYLVTQRGLILAAADGYRETTLMPDTTSARKVRQVTAAVCLSRVEAALRDEVEAINAYLEPLQMQLAQLISVASAARPITLPAKIPDNREQWLLEVWAQLAAVENTRPAFTYLNTLLSRVDRLYLLDELLSNIEGG